MKKNIAIGIDMGGTNTKFGLITDNGTILDKGNIKTTGFTTALDYVNELHVNIIALLQKHNINPNEVNGIGMGAPNANYYTGIIYNAPNLPWKEDIPMKEFMETAFQLPVTLTNDANAAAQGEMIYGVAKQMKNFVMITLGTGLGSGIVSNGQLIYGADGMAGELGHITIIPNGRLCGCGRKGCLEAYCSATGLMHSVKEWERNIKFKGYPKLHDAQDVYDAAQMGNQMALEVFDYTAQLLGAALANTVAVLSPEAFVFFGGLANADKYIIDATKKYMEEHLLYVYKNKVNIIKSSLPEADAAILGAAALAHQ